MATSLNDLAALLEATNRHSETEPLYRRALAIKEAALGPDHPDVAKCMSNLAALLGDLNRHSEAEPLYRRALKITEASFEPDHPDIATGLNNLATLLYATNRLWEAEPLMRRNVEIFLKFTAATGRQHPHLQQALCNYASILTKMGRSDAEMGQELRDLLAQYGVSLG